MKSRIIILAWALILSCHIFAQEVTVNVATAGTLRSMVEANDLQDATIIHVSGVINGDDVLVLKSLAGGKTGVENPLEGRLSTLDLLEATIVEGGNPYYVSPNPLSSTYPNQCFTQNDTIGISTTLSGASLGTCNHSHYHRSLQLHSTLLRSKRYIIA